jgi:hypothetical protein
MSEPQPVPSPAPPSSPEEVKVREELETIFLDLLTSAQKLSFELATLDVKDSYTRDELKDVFGVAKEVVANVKKMYRFLEKHGKKRQRGSETVGV